MGQVRSIARCESVETRRVDPQGGRSALMSLLAYGMCGLLMTGLMRWRQQQVAA